MWDHPPSTPLPTTTTTPRTQARAPALAHAAFVLAALHAAGIAELADVGQEGASSGGPSRAVEWLHAAAAAGHQGATLALSDRYLSGRGVPLDAQEGMRRARRVADALVRAASQQLSQHLPGEAVRLRERFVGRVYPSKGVLEWEEQEAVGFDVEEALGYGVLWGLD